MEDIKRIYDRIKKDIDILKEISIKKMYDDFFSKSKRRKEIIDSSTSIEIGIRKIVGDSYFYSMLEDNIMLLLDEYISNNNKTNIKIPNYYNTIASPISIPNREYKRFSRMDSYELYKKYIDGEYIRLDVFNNEPNISLEYSFIMDDDYKDPLLYDEIKEIQKVISILDKCLYLGFYTVCDGNMHELYEYNDILLFDFTVNLIDEKLLVTKLEISGATWELDNILD